MSKTIEVKILNGAKPEGTLLVVLFLFPSFWRTGGDGMFVNFIIRNHDEIGFDVNATL